jgi:GNAT superfamily N-acetyltransferase
MRTTLADGTPVLIREIRASDKRSLAAGLTRLSAASVSRRFLGLKLSFSVAELRYLTEVDGFDHHALVAVDERHPDELIAVARFVRRREDPTAAEAAIVVCDAYQHRRLGTRLAELMADAARARGVARIEASMSSDNHAALALMRTIAGRLTDGGHHDGVHELIAELG